MKRYPPEKIRNFCIIAHIDHGKSTLADRFLQVAGLVSEREFHDQMLDSLEIEQERGITIKSQAVALEYTTQKGEEYLLNFVDTPGHVDFSYEVSRAIQSCEGALLLIDATQGVEAQTLSNLYLATEYNLEILPVINKMDLPSADLPRIREQIESEIGLDPDLIFPVSAKTGAGITELLDGLIDWIPAPQFEPNAPLQALIFDSHYDSYRGVVIHIRLFQGELKGTDEIKTFSTGANYTVEEVGVFKLGMQKSSLLSAGEVGYFVANIKTIADIRIGDTVTLASNPCQESLPGFKEVKPVVFSSIYPVASDDYDNLVDAMERLKLNDASLIYEKDNSAALGFGFRCGFLGLLHLEVVQERLEREFDLNIVLTSPSVMYHLTLKNKEKIVVDNPLRFPDPTMIETMEEPYIVATIITPSEYVGAIITLCNIKRGFQTKLEYLSHTRVELVYTLPLAEILFDFYDKLKSISRGYASFDYEIAQREETSVVRMEILVNGESVDALSQLVFKESVQARGRSICKRLKEEIPRQQYKVALQAAVGSTIIARETIGAYRKDVTAKCYGGDITRKRKLLEKQKAGKKRMKQVGNIEIPQSAFLSVLRSDGMGE